MASGDDTARESPINAALSKLTNECLHFGPMHELPAEGL